MEFKRATMDDFDIAFDFIEKLWAYNTYDKDEVRDAYRNVTESDMHFAFFIVDDGRYCGFCHCTCFETFWMSGLTCYLSGLIIDEDIRGKGYGTAAVDEARRIALERGCKGFFLESGLARTQAHAFYDKYGFEKTCYGFEMPF